MRGVSDSLKLYRASPEAFFSSLDKKLLEIESQMSNCLNRIDDISALGEQFLATRFSVQAALVRPTSWIYFASLPNCYFDDVFEPEKVDGVIKRWVGRSGHISLDLGLDRSFQYDFEIKIHDFVSLEVAKTITLSVDGQLYPWIEVENLCHRTVILENAAADTLEIELAVDATLGAVEGGGKDVTFSFSTITIQKRG